MGITRFLDVFSASVTRPKSVLELNSKIFPKPTGNLFSKEKKSTKMRF